ncbi:MAG: hypothetical protein ACMZ7B_07515 [Balneola sp.]
MKATDKNINPAYDGHCAFAVSTGKLDVKGGKNNITVDGKTYLFSNPVAKILFKLLPKRIEKADKYWKER